MHFNDTIVVKNIPGRNVIDDTPGSIRLHSSDDCSGRATKIVGEGDINFSSDESNTIKSMWLNEDTDLYIYNDENQTGNSFKLFSVIPYCVSVDNDLGGFDIRSAVVEHWDWT